MIQRLRVWTLVRLNLECVVLLSKLGLNQMYIYKSICLNNHPRKAALPTKQEDRIGFSCTCVWIMKLTVVKLSHVLLQIISKVPRMLDLLGDVQPSWTEATKTLCADILSQLQDYVDKHGNRTSMMERDSVMERREIDVDSRSAKVLSSVMENPSKYFIKVYSRIHQQKWHFTAILPHLENS